MRWQFSRMNLLILSIFLLGACSDVEKTQHIEVFFIETSEIGDEGLFEPTGYKKVNAITSNEEGQNYIKSDVKSIEDFYDIEGNYIETEITHSTATLSGVTQTLNNNKNHKKKLQEPSTILISDEDVKAAIETFSLDTLTKEEKENVKEHVLSFMNNF